MAYPESTGPAAPATRPSTVTAAVYLLYLGAAIAVLSALMSFALMSNFRTALREAYEGTSLESQADAGLFGVIGAAVISLVIGAVLVLLAVFNGKGKNWARITTWVVGGIYLCCIGIGLAFSGLAGNMGGGDNNQGPTPEQVNEAMERNLPGWYQSLSTPLTVVSLLAVLGTIILLALPASNAFFRKKPEEPVWQPPTGPV
jgi:xanthine/uracil permease